MMKQPKNGPTPTTTKEKDGCHKSFRIVLKNWRQIIRQQQNSVGPLWEHAYTSPVRMAEACVHL